MRRTRESRPALEMGPRQRTPQPRKLELRPESLYKGDLGIAVLEADLRRPEQAHMPMFERDA